MSLVSSVDCEVMVQISAPCASHSVYTQRLQCYAVGEAVAKGSIALGDEEDVV